VERAEHRGGVDATAEANHDPTARQHAADLEEFLGCEYGAH
jgi:hypothetical protein